MKPVAWYQWGKTEKGYGWQPWQGPCLSIERHGITGQWEVHEADGSLLCLCVDYRSAQRVVARLRRLIHAQVTPDAIPDYAVLGQTQAGWVIQCMYAYEEPGAVYRTREEAEARMVR